MAHTVIETTDCANCSTNALAGTKATKGTASATASSTVASGSFNNPSTTYSGFEGTATVCIYSSSAGYGNPDAVNVATMPCVDDMDVHFADTVATPNEYALAYLGMALGKG